MTCPRTARAAAVLWLVVPALTGQTDRAKLPPNLVFVMADDLGYGDLGSYGQRRLRTPSLDRMAKEGRRYTQFYAGSTVCAPSRCVLMTGLHTGHCHIRGNGGPDLRAADVTLADVLKGAGYTTGLFGKWGLGQAGSEGVPTKQGFDEFFGYLNQRHAHNYWPGYLYRGEEVVSLPNAVPNADKHGAGEATEKNAYSHDLIVEEALGFVRRHREVPFFVYLALTIPHANNEARKTHGMETPDLGSFAGAEWPPAERSFAAMVERMDRDVGRLLQALADLNLDEHTLVVFTSDNGPHREGKHDPNYFDSRGGLRGIKRSLHDGGIRVPMLARWPGRIPAGTTSDYLGCFQDVLPTFAELANTPLDPKTPIDGHSFVASLLGREADQATHASLYWAFFEQRTGQALRMGKWKAVQQPFATPPRLYDLEADIAEQHDVAADHPDVVARAVRMMSEAYTPSKRWRFKTGKARR